MVLAITGDLHKENTVKTDNWENMSVWKGNCPTCGGGITLSSEIPIPEEKVRIKTVREAREEILQILEANGPMSIESITRFSDVTIFTVRDHIKAMVAEGSVSEIRMGSHKYYTVAHYKGVELA